MKTKFLCISLFLLCLSIIVSCASVTTERSRQTYETADMSEPFPPYTGPKNKIQVIRFGIPKEIAEKYPELADKRVGWGLCNRIVEGFYDTNRFEYVEEKKQILDRMMNQWALSQAGIYAETEEFTGLKAPEYLVYAEVYDFSVSHSEVLVGIAAEQKNTTIIGVQLRMVDVATGQYIPATGTGECSSTATTLWATADLPFDQTTVGEASQKAVNVAIRNLLKRIDAQK